MIRTRIKYVAATVVVAVASFGLWWATGDSAPQPLHKVEIDLDQAVAIALPDLDPLKPTTFRTPDGKEGWVVRIPGGRPIATPAYADGRLYVGGGYGSHEFYCFDAKTGETLWSIRTEDDGPSAAVVEDGCVAFNTESCTVVVADAATGKILWQEWLGDPLMSQPALVDGRVYIAYPNSKGDRKHRLLCADLKTGEHYWTCEITGDVITAPVVEGDRLFFTCFDGTSFCVGRAEGDVVWRKHTAGTSAPIVAAGRLVVTAKRENGDWIEEGIQELGRDQGVDVGGLVAAGQAGYLAPGAGGGVALQEAFAPNTVGAKALQDLDSSVGFATPPADAKLEDANEHLGVNTVSAAWAYQGSRGAPRGDLLMNAQGTSLNCLRVTVMMSEPIVGEPIVGETIVLSPPVMLWSAHLRGQGLTDSDQVFAPPSLGGTHMYLCSKRGDLVCVRQADGAVQWMYATKRPMLFQPTLAQGNLYAGTADGLLICLKTGDADADGWYAWGGNAQHNKK
jgi:Ca-activated chloride channel family protein